MRSHRERADIAAYPTQIWPIGIIECALSPSDPVVVAPNGICTIGRRGTGSGT